MDTPYDSVMIYSKYLIIALELWKHVNWKFVFVYKFLLQPLHHKRVSKQQSLLVFIVRAGIMKLLNQFRSYCVFLKLPIIREGSSEDAAVNYKWLGMIAGTDSQGHTRYSGMIVVGRWRVVNVYHYIPWAHPCRALPEIITIKTKLFIDKVPYSALPQWQ